MAEIRKRLWIIRGRQQIERVLHRCVTCQLLQSRSFSETAASLPAAGVQAAMPFEVTGVDFAGPLTVTPLPGDSTEMEMAYISLFLCATSRAVHLELVRDLSASK